MIEKEEIMNEELDKVINESITKPKMSFEEAVKACNGITLEEFSRRWDKLIDNDDRLV